MTKAFKKGFVFGFTSSMNLLTHSHIKRSGKFNGSVAEAWSGVGRSLSIATDRQGKLIGQTTGKSKKHNTAA